MHYDGKLIETNLFQNPVMRDKCTGQSIGINTKLSKLDIRKLNKMYPCKPTAPACGEFCNFIIIGLVFYSVVITRVIHAFLNPAKGNSFEHIPSNISYVRACSSNLIDLILGYS